MAPHSSIPFVKYSVKLRRRFSRWTMGCVAVVLCLSTLLPLALHAQTMLPVVIKLPPSFLRQAPVEKMDAALLGGVMKGMAATPSTVSQIAALRNTEVRATELRGLLPHQFDHHYFGLEATEAGGAFAITLVVEPTAVLENNAVNFVVLTEDGMKKIAAGIDPVMVKTAMGSPLLFDQVGNRLTALVPGSVQAKYTVVVFNNGKLPTTYTLQVEGGVLVDDGGQSFSAVKVVPPMMEAATRSGIHEAANELSTGALMATYEGVVKRLGIAKRAETQLIMQQLLPDAVRARQVSGALDNMEDRHYLNLATNTGGGEVTLTLRYESSGGTPTHLNFWVMTQDGVRQMVQGGLAQELNLAVGLPVAGEPGQYQARLQMAENMLYTVVVFSEGMTSADYTLSVEGGILVDRYGQTREAQAAEIELLALANH